MNWAIRTPTDSTAFITRWDLISAVKKDNTHCLPEDLQISLERPVLEVIDVELHHLIEAEAIPPRNLPEARDAGWTLKTSAMPISIDLDLIRNGRARSDE